MEYVVKSATGHPSAPKGGTPEYRNGPWYKAVHGKKQGNSMGDKKAYGYGAYANKKMRYRTIEQKWSALKKWYDEVLKDALPARRATPGSRRCLGRRSCVGESTLGERVGKGMWG